MAAIKSDVDFTRHNATIEIRFVNGQECCEWCNLSFKNRKNHYECALTGEEMVSPGDSIGWECPLRKGVSNEI